jgi:hypothetical protein
MFFGHQFTHDQNMRFRLTKKTLTNSKKLCAKKYFGELEGFRLLTVIVIQKWRSYSVNKKGGLE